MQSTSPSGMRAFTIMWAGQFVSTVGTAMSRFALVIWVWQITQQATPVTFMAVSSSIPAVLISPVAGALVDRWDRKRVMMVSDLLAGLCTFSILLLHLSGTLQVWHLYVTGAIVGASGAFQNLAYTAATTALVPKSQYTRISGMSSLAEYASIIAGPALGGVLLPFIGLGGVFVIDIITFLIAFGTLWWIHIPGVRAVPSENAPKTSLLSESVYGFRYIFERPGLIGLMLIYFAFNMAESFGYPLIAPMILARTGDNEILLGSVQAVMGASGIIGGLFLTAWGGPKRRINGLLIGLMLTGLFGDALMGLGQALPMWILAGFFLEFFIPVAIGSGNSIWQSKVAPEVQGRVFAARQLVSGIGVPVATVLGGVLADRVFEPLITGSNAPVFLTGLVGSGRGSGMGFMIVICGLLSACSGLIGYIMRPVRKVEDELPDHDHVVVTS